MKTIVIYCALFLAGPSPAFSQHTDSLSGAREYKPSGALSAQQYMQKGRSQKATGIVLGLAGGVLGSVGFVTTVNNIGRISDTDDPPKNEKLGAFLLIAGSCLSIASLPFYISGSMNRKKAFDILLENQTNTTKIENGKLMSTSSPSVTFKIGL